MSRKRTRIQTRRSVQEAVAAPERRDIAEAGIAEATKRNGRMLIRLIQAGWSKNNTFYPASVLKRDGAAAWPKGTQAFIDHASPSEDEERPVGSVAKLAAVQTEDARWDEASKSLVAEVQLFEPWKTPLMEMAKIEASDGVKAVGLSIRAWVTGEHGESEGREGFIVESIPEGRSVDFVTKPAAGGAILAVFESIQKQQVGEARSVGTFLESRLHLALTTFADEMYGDGRLTRPERLTLSSAIGDGLTAYTARIEADAPQLYKRPPWEDAPEEGEVAEALADDTRARLQRAIAAAHGDDEEYGGPWVHDFDPDERFVIYSGDGKTWRQSYSTGENGLQLAGDPVEVTRRTAYVPVDTPATEAADPAALTALAVEVTEMATELDLIDQVLHNSPTAATANADGSPPTATRTHITEGVSTMSGTAQGAQPDPAGTTKAPVSEEAAAIVASQLEEFRTRANTLSAALGEAQSAQRTAEAQRDAAITEARVLKGNEAGRIAVDKALADEANGVPESMYASIAPRVQAAVRGNVPMTDDGQVNTEALEALVVASIKAERTYAATVLESQGVGRPSGLGFSDPDVMTEEAFEQQLSASFARIGLDESTANLAAKGR